MARSAETSKSTAEIKALRIAKAALKSARLTAKASKARLRALKSEVKIQKQHHKWARKQVRVAKDALAQWRAATTVAAAAATAIESPASAAGQVKAIGGEAGTHTAKPAKRKALAIERHSLIPIAPKPAVIPAPSEVNASNHLPAAAGREPTATPGGATPEAE